MKQIKHWQDPLSAVLGLWLLVSPWVLGFAEQTTPTVNAVVFGIALIATAIGATFVPRAWEEWTEGAIGVWLLVSPWALAFEAMRNPMMSTVATGIAVLVLALWVLATDKDYMTWRTAH